MTRKCGVCPPWTQTVCRHAFGKYWNDKSDGGKGCDHPLDGVAEAWREAGWTPDKGATRTITIPLPSRPKMPRRPVCPAVKKIQSPAPARPKVSAEIMRQADLFFGRMK